MRKIMLMSSVSLDGFFEGPDRDISWHLVNEEFLRYLNEQFRAMGAFMYGRVTYELMADVWPTADRNPDLSAPLVEFAGIWRDMRISDFRPSRGSGAGPAAVRGP
jgi:dihydrofolate reductase